MSQELRVPSLLFQFGDDRRRRGSYPPMDSLFLGAALCGHSVFCFRPPSSEGVMVGGVYVFPARCFFSTCRWRISMGRACRLLAPSCCCAAPRSPSLLPPPFLSLLPSSTPPDTSDRSQ